MSNEPKTNNSTQMSWYVNRAILSTDLYPRYEASTCFPSQYTKGLSKTGRLEYTGKMGIRKIGEDGDDTDPETLDHHTIIKFLPGVPQIRISIMSGSPCSQASGWTECGDEQSSAGTMAGSEQFFDPHLDLGKVKAEVESQVSASQDEGQTQAESSRQGDGGSTVEPKGNAEDHL